MSKLRQRQRQIARHIGRGEDRLVSKLRFGVSGQRDGREQHENRLPQCSRKAGIGTHTGEHDVAAPCGYGVRVA